LSEIFLSVISERPVATPAALAPASFVSAELGYPFICLDFTVISRVTGRLIRIKSAEQLDKYYQKEGNCPSDPAMRLNENRSLKSVVMLGALLIKSTLQQMYGCNQKVEDVVAEYGAWGTCRLYEGHCGIASACNFIWAARTLSHTKHKSHLDFPSLILAVYK
jgi:hypothetical protein